METKQLDAFGDIINHNERTMGYVWFLLRNILYGYIKTKYLYVLCIYIIVNTVLLYNPHSGSETDMVNDYDGLIELINWSSWEYSQPTWCVFGM